MNFLNTNYMPDIVEGARKKAVDRTNKDPSSY